MNLNFLKRFVLVILVVCFLLTLILFLVSITISPTMTKHFQEGQPTRFEDSRLIWGEISDVAVCGETLYVMYDRKSIIECYDLYGNYQHSYFIYSGRRGTTNLRITNETLYFETRVHDYYSFVNGQYSQFYDMRSDAEQIEELKNTFLPDENKSTSNANVKYVLRGASVWAEYDDGSSCEIIHRPAWFAVFQGGTLMIPYVILFLLLAIILYRKQKAAK